MDLVCIVCPRGCHIHVDDNGVITGNTCKRGEEFAKSEMTCPMRTVCSTVATVFDSMPVLPVRTNGEIPKDKIKELMAVINNVKVEIKLNRGDVVVPDVVGNGVDLIATSTIH